ncbi:MAG: phosphate uptake regulator PhoU [Thermoplasmatota archaeon]
METRKVQITGKSTYIISLPKTWVNKVSITNGSSLIMIPRSDGTLLINPKLNENAKKIKNTITIDSQDIDSLFRKFIGAYLAGCDVIEIKSKENFSPLIRQNIRRLIHNVIGPEIVDESSNTVVINDLLDSSDLSLVQGLRRMYVITRGMHKDAILSLKNQDPLLAQDVETRDDEVDKFYWMIAKQHNMVMNDIFFADKMGVKPKEVLGYLLVARSIERIADHAKKLAGFTPKIKEPIQLIDDIVQTSDELLKAFDEAINAFNRNRFEYANNVVNQTKELAKKTEQLTKDIFNLEKDAVTIVSLAYIVDSLERTRAYILDIAETSINHQFALSSSA